MPASALVATAHDRLLAVQYLRALAAIMVMLSHTMGDMSYRGGPELFRYYYVGAAGVDLFFVISGFVMVYSAVDLFGVTDGWAVFLRKRLARIVPLYWLATLAYGLVQVDQGKWAVVRPDLVASSLVFWPYAGSGGLHLPVYSIGWTLNYEMFFYVVFATGLLFRRPIGMALMVGGLLALVLLGATVTLPQPLRFWSHPVLIDFLLGMAAGLAYLRGWRVPHRLAPWLGLLGLAIFVGVTLAGFNSVPDVPERFPRWLAWGVPSVLLFAIVAMRGGAPVRPYRLPVYLGDASYAIYLLHPLVIIGLRPLLPWLEALMPGHDALVGTLQLLAVAGAVLLGAMAVHSGIERPLARLLKGRGTGAWRSRPTEAARA